MKEFTSKTKARAWLNERRRRKRNQYLTNSEKLEIDKAESKGDPRIFESLWISKNQAFLIYVSSTPFERPFTDEWITIAKNESPDVRSMMRAAKYFVVDTAGGPEVVTSLVEAQEATAKGGTNLEQFLSEDAAYACRNKRIQDGRTTWWVVHRGHRTGVMREADCIDAICNFHNPRSEGPFKSKALADAAYIKQMDSTPARDTPIASPTEEEIDRHLLKYPGQKAVFAVRSRPGFGQVALSYVELIASSRGNTIKTFDSASTVWDNVAAAENWIRSANTPAPRQSRLASARARASSARPWACASTTPASRT